MDIRNCLLFSYMRRTIYLLILSFLINFSPVISAEYLEVYYLDVGQGDFTLIVSGNHSMLIDGGNPEQSQTVFSVLKQAGITKLDYIIATHADADHVGGLSAALIGVNGNVGTVFVPYQTCGGKDRFTSFIDDVNKHRIPLSVPEEHKTYRLGDAEFEIISDGSGDCQTNKSIVVRLVNGANSFLFTGDTEADDEMLILASDYNLHSDVLKAGHHGSRYSTTSPFLDAVAPSYTVISCGKNNDYGHPHQETLYRINMSGADVLRTDQSGHIAILSDGTDLFIFSQNDNTGDISEISLETVRNRLETILGFSESNETAYVLNVKSKKFHYPTCSSVVTMSPKNRLDVNYSRDEIINMGYAPCGSCKP